MSDSPDSGQEPRQPAGRVLFLSGDLMFASRVRAAAEAAGLGFQLAGDVPEEGGDSIRYVVLDLATRGGLAAGLPERCAERCPGARLIAYGPHVQATKLHAAREAGVPTVLTRGQFDSRLGGLFQS